MGVWMTNPDDFCDCTFGQILHFAQRHFNQRTRFDAFHSLFSSLNDVHFEPTNNGFLKGKLVVDVKHKRLIILSNIGSKPEDRRL